MFNADQRNRLDAELTRDEGYRDTVYIDSTGHATIGVGHNLSKPLSRHIIEELYEEDVADAINTLVGHCPWVVDLDPVRQRVLVNMCFNLGIGKLLGFHNTLQAVKEGRYADAAEGMRHSLWAKQVGKRAQRLAAMMESGRD